jgi:hypothetical protein
MFDYIPEGDEVKPFTSYFFWQRGFREKTLECGDPELIPHIPDCVFSRIHAKRRKPLFSGGNQERPVCTAYI